MVRIALAMVVLAGTLSGCAGLRASRVDDASSASIGERRQPLAGHWQGRIDETAGWFYQGSSPLDLTITPDGRWTGTVGKAKASGVARLKGRHLVLSGTAASETGHEEAVYLRLTGDDSARWGATRRDFTGGDTHATVSLRKTS